MPTVNQVLADESVAHAVSLDKYKLGVVRRIIALLNRSDARLAAALQEALDQLPADSFTVERLDKLLDEVRSINSQAYAGVSAELNKDLQDLTDYELGWQQKVLEATLPEPVLVRFPIAKLAVDQVYAAAMARPFQGRFLKDWAKTIEADRMTKVRNAVRLGYLEGRTTAQIVRDVRGTKVKGYADGFIERPRQDLATIVRTALSHTASVARENLYQANAEIIAAEDWTSTLDTKTSEQCRIRDKKPYEVGTHKPIGHKIPWLQGPGRLHFNCRSTSTPRTKSWRELGIPIEDMTGKQRASMDGAVPADMTYSQWLERQSDARKLEVLGPARYQMYKEGRGLDSFYSPSGEWLTIEQMKALDTGAFRQPTGEFTVYDAAHPTVKPDMSTPARKTAVAIEEQIRKDRLETGAFISRDGSVMLQRQGEPDSVGFPVSEFGRLKGSTFTHNHPGNSTFSRQDVSLASEIGLSELRAVGPTLRYTMSADKGWPEGDMIASLASQTEIEAVRRVSGMVNRGEIERVFAQTEAEHQFWTILSAKAGLKYTRERS
ncbi:hypothetical protein [Pseudomonas typographi]|uniref:hypothetical protein n=1 Tax=Pseudomonas typographi TaxID=2715964 RepID=UPI001688CC18|nr:hypothetical protein [Pseudomonas typographi]